MYQKTALLSGLIYDENKYQFDCRLLQFDYDYGTSRVYWNDSLNIWFHNEQLNRLQFEFKDTINQSIFLMEQYCKGGSQYIKLVNQI